MANGRKGVSFFPLTVTGKLPDANTGELITYPARKFDGTNANAGISTGAFYIWPSPVQDGGYLILSGTYAANKTDNVPVTYKIPFKPSGSETGNYIEVSQNHRYTVEITKADEYHLDFTLDVADWTDDGNIDDYEPGGDTDKDGMTVVIDVANGSYDKTTRTVTMAITDDAQFTIEGGSTSGYYTTMYYENMDTEHQWLTMDPPADNITKADAIPSIFTIKKNKEYKDTKFPIATIRFTDKITAKETVVIVEPIANPVVKGISYTEGSAFADNEVLLNKTATITDPSVTVSVFASGGSELVTVPTWLKVSPANSQTLSNAQYTFKADVSDGNFPDPFPVAGVTITAKNMGDQTKTQDITIKMKSNITVSGTKEGQAEYDANSNTIRLYNDENAKVTLAVNSIGGTELVNKPDWLTVTDDGNKNDGKYTFYVANNATTGVNSSFQIRSKADNSIIKTYKVYSISTKVTFSTPTKSNNYTTIYSFTTATPTIDYFACSGSYIDFTVNSPKGITVSDSWTKLNILSETTLATGQKETKIRMQTTHDDAWHSTSTSDCTLTVKDKYSGSTQKTITVKQYRIVYPGSKIPPNIVDGNGSFWIAGENGYLNETGNLKQPAMFTKIKNGTACPSGWRVPTVEDYNRIANMELPVNKEVSWSGKDQLKKALYGHFWSSDTEGRGFRGYEPGFGIWGFGADNPSVSYRCIKNK